MKNWIQPGRAIDIVAPYTVPAGSGVKVGTALRGVAQDDLTNAQPGVIVTDGVVEIAKTPALAIAVGDRLFWDDTNKVVNVTAAGQICVGVAVEAAVNPSPTVKMRLGAVT